jgi:hypothetical protein
MTDITNVLKKALEPYAETLKGWQREEVISLFIGFGNASIYWNDIEDYSSDKDFGGTFTENASSIISVLNELDITFEDSPWDSSEFYWTIFADAGNVRSDLVKAIENVGFKCYEHFDADDENHKVKDIKTFSSEPSL